MVVMVADTHIKESTTIAQSGKQAGKYEMVEDAEQSNMQTYLSLFNTSGDPHLFYDNYYEKSFVYKVKVPLDFMLYLYTGPLKFCNKGCKDNKEREIEESLKGWSNSRLDNFDADGRYVPRYPGVVTFADPDGVYGMSQAGSSPPDYPNNAADYIAAGGTYHTTVSDFSMLRYAQSCTVCTYPDNSGQYGGKTNGLELAETMGNYTFCHPMETLTSDADIAAYRGLCGVLDADQVSVVPFDGSCVVSSLLC